jgi:hypothetical protein
VRRDRDGSVPAGPLPVPAARAGAGRLAAATPSSSSAACWSWHWSWLSQGRAVASNGDGHSPEWRPFSAASCSTAGRVVGPSGLLLSACQSERDSSPRGRSRCGTDGSRPIPSPASVAQRISESAGRRRPPGVDNCAHAQRLQPHAHASEPLDLQGNLPLARPRCAAVRSPYTTHNREVGGSNPPGAMPVPQRMRFLAAVGSCLAAIPSVVRSSIGRFPRWRAQSDSAVPINRPSGVHLASTTGAHSRRTAAYADHSPARTVASCGIRAPRRRDPAVRRTLNGRAVAVVRTLIAMVENTAGGRDRLGPVLLHLSGHRRSSGAPALMGLA